jgi:hypothetical protein
LQAKVDNSAATKRESPNKRQEVEEKMSIIQGQDEDLCESPSELPRTVGTSKPRRGSFPGDNSFSPSQQLATPPFRPLAAPEGGSPGMNDATREMLVAKLEAFYEVVNPGKCGVRSFRSCSR